ncbi:MAG: DUF3405 domain-containing protein, partial [Methanoregula sp.]|nr:DUF3405 domain-containing protein [Methanoregula sp.]
FERFLHLDYPGSPDVWLVLDGRTPGATEIHERFERCYVIYESELFSRLPYPRSEGASVHANVHFPILDFYLHHPEYDYYWVIEFDVRYTGDWGSFLRPYSASGHDFVTCHIRYFYEEPCWWWWDSLHHPVKTFERTGYIRSFNVIYRISNRALALIHGALQDGWRGHPEVLLPTILYNSGCTLLDFGGNGTFVLPGSENKHYTSGSTRDGVPNPFCTLRWRPSTVTAGIRRNKLYHPVKSHAMMEPLRERMRFFNHWIRNYIRDWLHR